ncbi:MAG: hypothetical protein F4060_04785 [Holophagales bacterium]|nr:hypothetical protein [Holophagales bacterium]MYG29821.1 hypothetical protein [Holophagales bacterium]MYI79235.1 hypothetical protein [Holophagales bacterium]
MNVRIALLSALFLLVAGTAMATPTAGEATKTAQYFPVPCDDSPFPGPGRPYPLPLPFPSPWPGPTDQCIPIPLPF